MKNCHSVLTSISFDWGGAIFYSSERAVNEKSFLRVFFVVVLGGNGGLV